MRNGHALLFIGACGIAVRSVAPFLTDKTRDVPVLVMDEKGRYVIPILSGHLGGANELAGYIAARMGAEPVITTATDVRQKFAVDLFAKDNDLDIADRAGIVRVSSKVLAGREVTISIEPGHESLVERIRDRTEDDTLRIVPYPPEDFADIAVTSKESVNAAIRLIPREYVVGIGCKKGKDVGEIRQIITRKTAEFGIENSQIRAAASISRKREEPGIVEWCGEMGIPFLTYTAEELREVQGDFTASAFVEEQVGVDNVCERAALRACGDLGKTGDLAVRKYAENGVTIAIAKILRF
ncbi:MAG: cobalamin biosynthesis protein [Clostridium sp.]|nr:cobalamin biosynthesis protein [Acetatifactor muris]MCM1563068.1 cobalamin biosynthesis protein [Clostridium sp.]